MAWRGAAVRRRIDGAAAARRLRPIRVGRWVECRGRPMIDIADARAGDAFRLFSDEATTVVTGHGRLRFGDDVFVNSGTRIRCDLAVTIEDHVAIGFDVVITDTDHHGLEGRPVHTAPVVVGAGAWIGGRAIVLPGVTIGARAVIGAGSVVTHDVPADTLFAGNPAREIRQLAYPEGIVRAAHG